MRSIRRAGNLRGKRVLVRGGLNETMDGEALRGDFRLRKMLPLLTFLREAGARTILVGHVSGVGSSRTLQPVARYFAHHVPVSFIGDLFDEHGRAARAGMHDGEIVLAENLRRYPGEVAGDAAFASELAALADSYVNEDFSTSHRPHASIVLVPQLLPGYAGLQFEQEYKQLSRALNPPHPSLVIIGGAKPETKVPLIRQFLDVADRVFVGGLSANEFFLKMGHTIGSSLVSGKDLGVESLIGHPKLMLPKDVRVLSGGTTTVEKRPEELTEDDRIVDVGPETLVALAATIAESASIVWNGPLGDSDRSFLAGTEHLAHLIADSGVLSIIGGGDTIACIEPLGIERRVTFLSTAGAAMINFLLNGTLPGIEALKRSPR